MGQAADTYWDAVDDRKSADEGSELAQRVMRLSVILAMGAVLTGVALAVTQQLHPVASPATVANSSPQLAYSDPPWTVPLPAQTAAPSPAPSSAPSRRAAPKPKATSKSTLRTGRTTTPTRSAAATTTPVVPRTPAILGPPTDSNVETVLTTHCVRTLGALAVAALGNDRTWGCRHAEQTTRLDMTAACLQTYGAGARSQRLDKNNPYSWRCFR